MIVTLTPNPSFDLTMAVGQLEPGQMHRAQSSVTEAGGKGLNVSRALSLAGIPSRCLFPANASDGAHLTGLLHASSDERVLEAMPITMAGLVRTNVTVTAADGETTKINAPGPTLSAAEADALLSAAVKASTSAESSWLAACGSLPKGLGSEFFGTIGETVGPSVRVAIDTSDDALEIAVRRGCDLIKPNQSELAMLTGMTLVKLGDVVEACRAIVNSGVGQVLASLGSSGAMLVTADAEIHATGPQCEVVNTVGAGDATLAGFLAAGGDGEKALQTAVAWGTAAVQSATTSFKPPNSEGVAAVNLQPPQWDLLLQEQT